ncbi:MAG TPA: multicopper oxidase family protein [Pyrinomonadaceae bacterium]|nr:multicopper oxidase family protein [Pyrinomonadaceae bacterium]
MPKNKAKDRQKVGKKTEGTISRRTVLKIGAAAGAAGVLAPSILSPKEALGFQAITEPVLCTTPTNSPPHHPFVQDFAAPFPAEDHPLMPAPTESRNEAAGEAPRADHQRWAQFTPAQFTHELEAKPGLHTFHPDYSPTYIWGFNGLYPGPQMLQRYGKSTIVRFRNSLPLTTTTFGRNEMTIHLHNGHHGSESDGFAGDFFSTGFYKDHLYPNIYAGLDSFGGIGDHNEKMGTFWYHDHRAEFTAPNNQMGLNGQFIVYDETDPGHEHPSVDSLQLPGYYGITDFPIILNDKKFCPTANGRTEMVNAVAGGDKWIVNGMIQPKLTVRRRKYRFRILNTGPTKVWTLSLVKPDGSVGTMTCIATDANFLEHPLRINDTDGAGNSNATTAPIVPGGLKVAVAERYDIVIDFTEFPAGSKLYLKEAAQQFVGLPSPDPLPAGLDIRNVLMQFSVVNREPWFPVDTPAIPATLCTYPSIPDPVDNFFEWQFIRDPAVTCPAGTHLDPPRMFRIRRPTLGDTLGCVFDADRPAHAILRGTSEEWLINNMVAGSAWAHPVHIHFEEFRTIERLVNGVVVGRLNDPNLPIAPLFSGRKDVNFVEAGQGARIRMRFRDYNGAYLIHCHNMAHEDAFMMVRWDICPDQASLDACNAILQVCQEVQQCVPD